MAGLSLMWYIISQRKKKVYILSVFFTFKTGGGGERENALVLGGKRKSVKN
jgi:hypothetical protein